MGIAAGLSWESGNRTGFPRSQHRVAPGRTVAGKPLPGAQPLAIRTQLRYASPEEDTTMTPEEQLIQRYFDAFNRHDIDGVMACFQGFLE